MDDKAVVALDSLLFTLDTYLEASGTADTSDRPSTNETASANLQETHPIFRRIRDQAKDCFLLKLENESSHLKLLEIILNDVKKYKLTSDEDKGILEIVVAIILHQIWVLNLSPKVYKKLLMILSTIENKDECIVYRHLQHYFESTYKEANKFDFTKWVLLITASKGAQKYIDENLIQFLKKLDSHVSKTLDDCNPWTLHRQRDIHTGVKMVLLIFQILLKKIVSAFWGPQTEETIEIASVIQDLLADLISVLRTKEMPRDSVLLAGTTMGMFLSMSQDEMEKKNAVWKIYSQLSGHRVGDVITLGEVSIKPMNTRNPEEYSPFGQLALLNGILSCFAPHELLYDWLGDTSPHRAILAWMFVTTCDLCLEKDFQFHTFQVLTLWFQKAQKCLPALYERTQESQFGSESVIMSKTLELVLTHLDSPIDGVNELVMNVFRKSLKIHSDENVLISKEKSIHESQTSLFYDSMLMKLMAMSWHAKGKHSLLAELLPYLSVTQFLSDYPKISCYLLECLSTNYLAPSSTDLYKAILVSIKSNEEGKGIHLWDTHFKASLIDGLSHPESLLCYNTGHYWLTQTLKVLPYSYKILERELQECLHKSHKETRTSFLQALVAVIKTARNYGLLKELPCTVLREALHHSIDDLRSDAFTVLCVAPKKTEPVTATEIQILKEFVPYNLNISSPPFRQKLLKNLGSVLMRMRDSSLSEIKKHGNRYGELSWADLPKTCTETVGFVDWFWNESLRNLTPGSNYQRLKTGLDWIKLVLDVFTNTSEIGKRKGNTPEAVVKIQQIAAKLNHWDFYSSKNIRIILSCTLDGTEDIRENAGSLLCEYFPWPLELKSKMDATIHDSTCKLLQRSLQLCYCPKNQEAESGAMIVNMIYQKCCLKGDFSFDMTFTDGLMHVSRIDKLQRDPSLHFISQLSNLIEQSVSKAKINVLSAAKQVPAHGLLMAVQRCISGTKHFGKEWKFVVSNIIRIVSDLCSCVLDVLGGRSDNKEAAPSFEQMSLAINDAISESAMEGDDDIENTEITPEHQLVMCWCWINIRESSLLLGGIVENVPISINENAGILTLQNIEQIGSVFQMILTRCRHRGAIEGCNLGFSKYCFKLSTSSEDSLHEIPKHLQQQVLDQVSTIGSKSSVTRRSAGLPYIITTIVANEAKAKQSANLHHAMKILLEISSQPLPLSQDQKLDLPQVHAMNILRHLFREASVAQSAMLYIENAVLLAVDGFLSTSWAIRNAATMLYGSLISRMLGQKKIGDEVLNTTTATEFFARYPKLEPFLLHHITEASIPQTQGHFRLHPSLFPVLSIFGRLAPGVCNEDGSRLIQQFRDPIQSLASSSLYSVRKLAAVALVPLVPEQIMASFALELVESIQMEEDSHRNTNLLHGLLLQINRIVVELKRQGKDVSSVVNQLQARSWLLTAKCHLIRAEVLKLFALNFSDFCENITQDNIDSLTECMEHTLKNGGKELQVQVGDDQYVYHLVTLWLSLSKEQLFHQIKKGLDSGIVEIELNCLKYLKDYISRDQCNDQEECGKFQNELFQFILREPAWEPVCYALQCVIDIYQKFKICAITPPGDKVWKMLMQVLNREPNSKPACLALTISSILMKSMLAKKLPESEMNLENWSRLLKQCSDINQADLLRLHAAYSVRIVGVNVMSMSKFDDVIINLFKVVMQLLVDSDPDIRQEAAAFVHDFLKDQTPFPVIHSNIALELFVGFMIEACRKSTKLIEYMYYMIKGNADLINVVSHEMKTNSDELFEPEDSNAYREKVVQDKLLISCLLRALMENPDIPIQMMKWCQQETEEVTEVFSTCMLMLDTNSQFTEALNGSCCKKSYEGIIGYLSCMRILQTICHACNLTKEENKLKDTVERLYKIDYLHPGIN